MTGRFLSSAAGLRGRRRRGAVVWGAGLLLAAVWSARSSAHVEARGYGFAPSVEVSAAEPGRVLELPVGLHDRVTHDDVVVRMDPSLLAAELELARARV